MQKYKKYSLFKVVLIILACVINLNAQNTRPNIVVILADDLGFECIAANGGTSYKTPNIDKLASQGVRFENCHAQPLCTPSRVQLMTGQYNVRNYLNFGKLGRNQTTFGNLFKNAGYQTAIAGKWQLGKEKDSPQHFGFDQSCLWQQTLKANDSIGHDTRYSNPVLEINGEPKYYTNGEFGADVESDFLCHFIEENKAKSFLVYYPMTLSHCPFVPTPDSKDWNPKSKGSMNYKGKPVYFSDMVTYMDKVVGKIVAKIDELGLGNNTLIIFTGDNGTDQPIISMLRGKEYPGGKQYTTDNGTHVPLIARWSGRIEANKECFDLIDFTDFLPTICEATSIKTPATIPVDGVSFLPQLLGKKGSPRDWIYSWYSRTGKLEGLSEFARNTDYKLYTTGQFFNIKGDFFEKTPLPLDKLNKKEETAYKSLNEALSKYKVVGQPRK